VAWIAGSTSFLNAVPSGQEPTRRDVEGDLIAASAMGEYRDISLCKSQG